MPSTQDVVITGEAAPTSPIPFTQAYSANQLFINDEAGDSARSLTSFAEVVTASASGQISIEVTAVGGSLGLGGLAIRSAAEAASSDRLFAVRVVGSTATIYEIDPSDGSALNSFNAPTPVGPPGPQGLAVGPNSLFYIDGAGTPGTRCGNSI